MIVNETKCNNILLLHVTGGGTANELLKELAEYAIENGYAKEGYAQALIKREEEYPTGIQAKQGVAIPHADLQYTNKGTIIIAILENSAQFHEMGTHHAVQVEIVFLLLIQEIQHQVHVLESIVTLIQDELQMKSLQSESAISTLEHVFEAYV